MAIERVITSDSTERLEEWRRALLVSAGLEPDEAGALAVDERVDLHALLELVDRGCPAHLAARILAPLEGGPSSC